MNAVEIEEAISALAEQPFDGGEFPFAFLQAFGNKETTIKRLRKGESNKSDLPGGVLQTNNIHIAVAAPGAVGKTMSEESLKEVAAAISAKRVSLIEEARELAKRALKFKQERGRLPSITSPDAWEKRMAEGVAFLARMKAEASRG
jgi:coenzyme F420-reducing hydrogenase alpha subunit